MLKIPEPKTETQALFKTWATALKKVTRRGGPAPEELHLLGSASIHRLTSYNLPWQTRKMFEYWGNYHVKEIHRRKSLVVERNKKPRVLSLIRHYRLEEYQRAEKGEANAFTLLHEQPNKNNTIPPKGCGIGGPKNWCPVFLEEEVPRVFSANCQTRVTVLGRKGLAAMHSQYQLCPLAEVGGGIFQRFLLGPSPEGAIRRAAITIRKLAEADPKTSPIGEKTLVRTLCEEFNETAKASLEDIERALAAKTPDELVENAEALEETLPSLTLSGLTISVSPERAYGFNPNTWAVSLQTSDSKKSGVENQAAFTAAWKALVE